jgi:uncharacterized phosphosugar-binding protein
VTATTKYYQAATGVIETILKKEQGKISAAALMLADQIAQGNLINVFGSGGHSFIGAEEMFYRAGGLVPVNPIFETGVSLPPGALRSTSIERTPGFMPGILETYGLKAGQLMIIINAYGINAATIDTALVSRKLGLKTIALTSPQIALALAPGHPSRHPSGKNLHEIVDLYIDTHVPMGDAAVELAGFPQRVGPVSTIANAFAIECMVVETIELLIQRGIDPPVWKSGNSPGGDEYNQKYLDKYVGVIKHL